MAKKDFLKAFMAYNYFSKKKEEREMEEKRRAEEELRSKEQERKNQLSNMEKDIKRRIAAANNLYEKIITESGFKAQVQDTMQMVRDLWIYSFAEFVTSDGMNSNDNPEDLLDELVEKLIVYSPVTGREHLLNMQTNVEYRNYINGCLDGDRINPGFFWILLASMSGNEGEYTKDTSGFTREYCETVKNIGEYLNYRFPESNLNETITHLVNDMLNKSLAFINKEDMYGDYQAPSIINPLM